MGWASSGVDNVTKWTEARWIVRLSCAMFVLAAASALFAQAISETRSAAASPTSQINVPSNGTTISGDTWLGASTQDSVTISSLTFDLTGGSVSVELRAIDTDWGWLYNWDTDYVPNGVYAITAAGVDIENNTAVSSTIKVTVDNPVYTKVLIPSSAGVVTGTASLLNASAVGNKTITGVQFMATGDGLTDQVVATGVPTLYGWLATWNTTAVPGENGEFTLQSVATETGGVSATSAPISVTVDNPQVQFQAPVNTATIAGENVNIQALTEGGEGASSVYVTLTGGSLSNFLITTLSPIRNLGDEWGLVFGWNSTSVPNGTYTMKADYVDPYASGTSTITVTVSNP